MPNGLIIFIVIVVLSAIIGAVSQVLKNQQQAEQARAARARAAVRNENNRESGRTSSDIDRFLDEIDKLRRKSVAGSAEGPAVRAPVARRPNRPPEVPTVGRARSLRPPEEVTRSFPGVADRPLPTARTAPPVRVEDLPVAPVIGWAAKTRPAAATAPPRPSVPTTEFSRQLANLLATPSSIPMAIVLQEVLGPPKARR
jgi:hypothetical protein